NSRDKFVVTKIAEYLKKRGVSPWLDTEQVPPGRWFQDVIQQAIPGVKCAAILIGAEGAGKWQTLELRAFISRCVDTGIPVIPVLLPGATQFPNDLIFLKELNWVQFQDGPEDAAALMNLEWGITGKQPKTS